ncbi:sperm-associated antigen 5 [Rana temporaria]|uniref:sperm-associated antigen 5 n=1 Tax=Rana temporaria TaxID=8407 RepID=UPI001AAD6801|nr:sperm-associated antigen 5 [Rana temporaria]
MICLSAANHYLRVSFELEALGQHGGLRTHKMSSPAFPASNENQIPLTQTVHRKSVGRTALKPLGVLNSNSLNNQRHSLAKPPSNTSLFDKETSLISAGIPVSVWVDSPSDDDDSVKSSAKQSSFSLENKELQVNFMEYSTNLKADYQSSQPCESVLVSDMCSDRVQETVLKKSNITFPEEYNTMVSLASEAAVIETSCIDGQQMVSAHQSGQTTFIVCSNAVAATLLETSTDLFRKSSLNKDNSSFSDCAVLTSVVEECSLVTDIGFISDFNNLSAYNTYEINQNFDGESDVCHLPLSGEMLALTQKVENWGIFETEDEKSNCSRHDVHAKVLPSSLLGDAINEDKSKQIADASSTFLDSAMVLDKLDSIVGHAILSDECSLPFIMTRPVKTITTDDEFSSCSIENTTESGLDMRESTDKSFFPIGGSTPHSKRTERDSTKVTNTEWLRPSSSLHQTGHSSSAFDPQRSEEFATSANCTNCPTPVIPPHSKPHVLSPNRSVCNNIFPEVLASLHEVGTAMTPISTSEEITWTTPVMLLNKSMNTSWNLKGKGVTSAKDNASETDYVLWNFSKETFCQASREELIHRLEGTLIVVEVLSRQLQDWQQQTVTSKPSEQRDVSTQTCVMYDGEGERYYRNLYFQVLSREQSLQYSHEDEKRLQEVFQEATKSLASYESEAVSMVAFAENLYETVQKDRVDWNQKVSCTRSLLEDYMTSLSKMRKKMENNELEKEKMKACMEEAQLAKTAADQCLEDLEIHSSAVIAQLRRDLESERKMGEAVREANEQQSSYNEELVEFVHRAHSVSSEVEDDRTQLLIQCSQARELMSRHRQQFRIMKAKTQSALEKYDGIMNERDHAILEKEEMSIYLADLKSLNEQTKLENSRLGSELESLMERLCIMESEINKWREDNSELAEQLSARDSSMMLLEKELNEATARGQSYQHRIKYLSAEVVPSLDYKLSEVSSQNRVLQAELQALKMEYASKMAYYTESLEFLEQENRVCQEQITETEAQRKIDHLSLLERNYQCENLKDIIKKLEEDVNELRRNLADAENEAQNMKANAVKEMAKSSYEVSKITAPLLDVIRNLKESSRGEVEVNAYGPPTPGGSLAHINTLTEESFQTTILNTTGDEDPKAEHIWSEMSAFTVVKPVASPSASTPVINLADLLLELSSVVSDVVIVSSRAMDTKQDFIRSLKMEITSLKEELQNQSYQNMCDVRDLQDKIEKLRKMNGVLEEKITSKEKHIGKLQEVVHQYEQKRIQHISKMNEMEDVIQENSKLKLLLKQCESEVEVLKRILAQNLSDMEIGWVEEKLMMHKDLTALNIKLNDVEYSNSLDVQRLLRHRDILEENFARSEAEVKKLDDIIEKIREAFHSVPDIVNQCTTLRQLKEFLD